MKNKCKHDWKYYTHERWCWKCGKVQIEKYHWVLAK